MEGGSSSCSGIPNTPDEIYEDFKSRRVGIIKALTTDYEEFYQQCDQKKESLMGLYGLPDESWKVVPVEEKLPLLPNPVWGINEVQQVMTKMKWKRFVAENSHIWLHAMAYFYCARARLGENEKGLLLKKIESFEAIEEAVQESAKPSGKQRSTRKPGRKRKASEPVVTDISPTHESEDQREDNPPCPICGQKYTPGKWIQCDICQEWLHCKCVDVGSEEDEGMKQYICPFCFT